MRIGSRRLAKANFGGTARYAEALLLVACTCLLAACSFKLNPYSLDPQPVKLIPDSGAIAFEEISYDARLERVLVPAAGTGKLALINPDNQQVQIIDGFSTGQVQGSQVLGITSATVARGYIFAIDQSGLALNMVDAASGAIIGTAPLSAESQIVRYVPPTNEVWVTQRDKEQIEVFSIPTEDPFTPVSTMTIPIPKGPEGLVIDRVRGLAFTNQPDIGMTAVLQVQTHGMINQWGNGCSDARHMALDEERGYLFVGCNEGKVVMMDISNDGHQMASQIYGGGVNFIAYNPRLQHLYLPSGDSAILAVFAIRQGVSIQETAASSSEAAAVPTRTDAAGTRLVRLGTADTALNATCITVDDDDGIWVCDPTNGQVLYIRDTFPASTATPE